jgi:hypothetical protein
VMTTVNGNRPLARDYPADAVAIAQVASAERIARAVVVAFDSCDEMDVPLTEIQKITMLEAILLEFDGFAAHLRSVASVGQVLRDLDQLR